MATSTQSKVSLTLKFSSGHQKVAVRCTKDEPTPQHAGRPRADGVVRDMHNGWFMVMEPISGRVVGISEMKDPENNEIVFKTLRKVLPQFPKATLGIYDRACKVCDAVQVLPTDFQKQCFFTILSQ